VSTLDVEEAREILYLTWKEVKNLQKDVISDKELVSAIRDIIQGKTKSYRYALLTQVLAKTTNPQVDCRCLQVKRGNHRAFDARSFCKKVVLGFERIELEGILGGSSDPYVSKPLRHIEISREIIGEIKDKEGWMKLHRILAEVEEKNSEKFTREMLKQILLEIYRLLSEQEIKYKIPKKSNLTNIIEMLVEYFQEPSGGIRPQVVMYSLFKTMGETLRVFDDVTSAKITVANSFAGRVADIECYRGGKIILAVGVKDKEPTVSEVNGEILRIVREGIPNTILMVFRDIRRERLEEISKVVSDIANVEGKNILFAQGSKLKGILEVLLLLISHDWKKFIENTCQALDEYAPYEHRRKWAELLSRL
jgi:hypothetical protein